MRSPRRLIALLFFAATLAMGPFRVLLFPRSDASKQSLPPESMEFIGNLDVQQVSAVGLGLFVVALLFQSTALLGYRGSYKPADVDVLFPTPISPRMVMGLRIARDTFLAQLWPLLLYAMTFKRTSAAWNSATAKFNPEFVSASLRTGFLSYLLLSTLGVSLGYASSLYFYRSEPKAETQRRLFGWGIALYAITFLAYIVLMLRGNMTIERFEFAINQPWVKVVYFPALLASNIPLGVLKGDPSLWGPNLAMLLALIFGALVLALNQSKWLYEICAMRAALLSEVMSASKVGNAALVQARLRTLKGKTRARTPKWIREWAPTGPTALIWRDFAVLRTGALIQVLILPSIVLILLVFDFMKVANSFRNTLDLIILGMMLWVSITTQLGPTTMAFADFLRRADVVRPLPFSTSKMIYAEVVGKSILPIVSSIAAHLCFMVVRPHRVDMAIGSMLLHQPVIISAAATVCLMTILLPDIDDPTQAGLRGLLNLLGVTLVAAFPIALAVTLAFGIHLHPILSAIPAAIISAVMGYTLTFLAAKFAENVNPRE